MSKTTENLQVVWFLFVVGIIFGITCRGVMAQEPADVKYFPTSGVYTLRAQAPPDLDLLQICFARVYSDPNTPNEELGCVASDPNQIVSLAVEVRVTPKLDAEIRGFAYDTSGNVSDPSPNAGRIDFTPPGQVRFQQ